MAKQPTGSSDAFSAGGNSDPAQGVRQAAENTLSQARQAVDQYMREATRLHEAAEASADAAQSGTREINRKAIGFAETNVNAAFDFAQQLVREGTERDRSTSAGVPAATSRADEQPDEGAGRERNPDISLRRRRRPAAGLA